MKSKKELKRTLKFYKNGLCTQKIVFSAFEEYYQTSNNSNVPVISSACNCYRTDEDKIVMCNNCLKELTGIDRN